MHLPRLSTLAILLLLAAPLAAQPGEPLPRGRVVERVRVDSIHGYALYLPSGWTAERRWPLLVALDPGGRGLLPVERFRGAAERRGWIVVGSYDARNGDAAQMEANDRAVDALLADAQRRFSIDPRRLYFAGMSGMARYAWGVAARLDGKAAGLIGAAAAFPRPTGLWLVALAGVRPFPYFGTVGTTDFNREEMEAADSALDATSLPHRLARFEGAHGWPPDSVAARAVDWLELQAMKGGTLPVSPAFADSQFAAGMARARAFEAAGAPLDAEREYRALVGDFAGLHPTADAAARLAALGRNPALERARARRIALARRVYAHRAALDRFVDALRSSPDGTVSRGTLAALRTDALLAEARDSAADRERAQAAARMLAMHFVALSDLGAEMTRAGRRAHAETAFRVARLARPAD